MLLNCSLCDFIIERWPLINHENSSFFSTDEILNNIFVGIGISHFMYNLTVSFVPYHIVKMHKIFFYFFNAFIFAAM